VDDDVVAIARSVVVLHASDPASVVLSSIQPAGVLPKGVFSGVFGRELKLWV
jgi:hypothetical protein